MGVVNVTPDSFSDGGDFADPRHAVWHGLALADEGADILDIGGESTRPGADPVSVSEELDRVIPVIEGLRDADVGVPISIDTRHAAVMQAAVAAGAGIINDVSALTHDPDSMTAAASLDVPIVLMHARGTPQDMQNDPQYDDVVTDVFDYLAARIDACSAAGIDKGRLIVDPGIGFGKTLDHNLALLEGLETFRALDCPILVGVSRKRFIGELTGVAEPKDRVVGSIAAGLAGIARGVHILRVHDVAQTVQALAVWRAINEGREPANP